MSSIGADYYDGKTSRRRRVTLLAEPGLLRVTGDGVERDAAIEQLEISERLGSAPQLIRFEDGAFCELREPQGREEFLTTLGHRRSQVEWAQLHWGVALGSLLAIGLFAVAVYLWGLPWAAERAAERIPAQFSQAMGENLLETLDTGPWFEPSQIAPLRQREIMNGLDRLKGVDGAALPPHRLVFRSSPKIGANAVTLPDGTIVLLDQLVELADNDEQINAVLGHELGHVRYRHDLRMLLQGSFVGAFAAWWFGDFNSLLVAGPAALLQSRYSRGFESEADHYCAQLLRANGLKPALLAQMLEKLGKAHGMKPAQNRDGQWLDYLSSHPAPDERIKALQDDQV